MGNMQCPAEDAGLLATVARDICPFPHYSPNPLYVNMLATNSSLHLKDHYTAVQASLTPKQLEDFTQSLRTTFGREGRVALGSFGVVALSLAVLFDTLAKQTRGELVSDSGPIPGLFIKDLRGYYSPHIYTVSEYLRLLPHIANNPTRMREETERYFKLLKTDKQVEEERKRQRDEDTSIVNNAVDQLLQISMEIHLLSITNSSDVRVGTKRSRVPTESPTEARVDAAHVSKTRKRRLQPPENFVTFNLNCDPEAASKDFLAEVQKSNDTIEAFNRCHPGGRRIPKTWLHYIARLDFLDVMHNPIFDMQDELTHRREFLSSQTDFDLKANALGKWVD